MTRRARAAGDLEGSPSFPQWQATAAGASFPETRWSVVVNAGREDPLAAEALEILCRTYWYPLYAFVRFQGVALHDAQDLTQGFFEHLLSGESLAAADPGKGRLRSYLLGALKHYLAYQRRREGALKRGGGGLRISIDEEEGERRLKNEMQADPAGNPDRLFERRWALMVLDRVLEELGGEYRRRGKSEEFRLLSSCLARDPANASHAETAAALGTTAGAVKVAVHRMRKRYREILQREILATVASEDEVESEIDYLFSVLR